MKENSGIEVEFKPVQDVVDDIELCDYKICYCDIFVARHF